MAKIELQRAATITEFSIPKWSEVQPTFIKLSNT